MVSYGVYSVLSEAMTGRRAAYLDDITIVIAVHKTIAAKAAAAGVQFARAEDLCRYGTKAIAALAEPQSKPPMTG